MKRQRSEKLFKEAERCFPGGVNSPVRAFKAVGGHPLFIKRASGSRICDEDGNEFIDYVCSWGPLILGHAHPRVLDALREALEYGTTFGAPTEKETTLAMLIRNAMPSIEELRFVNSGTEAVMSSLRLARAFTGRDKVIKFAGCYHGHSDGLLVKAGSGVATIGLPDSPGVPSSYARNTLTARYNDIGSVDRIFNANKNSIAAVIVEPVCANMGVIPPDSGFLESLRALTESHGSLLVFDEVITGFRLAPGGAQALYRVTPDLTCLGKIIGGGLPVGAYGGRKDIMDMIAPSGPVYQAGTLSGNPIAMTAGIATLQALAETGVYENLEKFAATLQEGLCQAAAKNEVPVRVNRAGSIMTLFFTESPVHDYESAIVSDTRRFSAFFRHMLHQGIYLPPSQFEAMFLSTAHAEADIGATVNAALAALQAVQSELR
ncbi:MAG: glutamate-1-semialdehyde 2,1-aminomutase [Dehalococcoidia bacterium]|nr:glutamate-1-semialdehyde 2,1-aminomutase [Dehalococcoidia bacterium]